MTRSMTAFARQQSDHAWGTLVWEIRSVNHRYLEPGFRLPESLRHLEAPLRDQLRKKLSRGKVDSQLKLTFSKESSDSLSVNESLLSELHQACIKVKQTNPGAADPTTLELLKWQGVIQEEVLDINSLEQEALNLCDLALDALVKQRENEGQQLQKHVLEKLGKITEIVAQIRNAMPAILKAQSEKLQAQTAELEISLEPGRLEQEVILLTQKSDITEEVDRLDTHLLEVERVIKQHGPVGRRLDFLMQELNREANTVCSKAIVTETTLGAVEMKVLIEQMREQIQNIE